MNSPQLLSSFEHCHLQGFWNRDWERAKLDLIELLRIGITEGVTSSRSDFGQAAGEKIISTAAEREIVSDQHNLYDQCVHYASIADVVSHALRQAKDAPWLLPEPIELGNGHTWHSGAFLAPSGASLRRIVLASSWSDERHYAEARSLFSLGEVAAFGMPLQEAVIILGASRDGKRHGPFSKGMQHPVNKRLRFRKKTEGKFKDSWGVIFREDHDEIDTHTWLQAMYEDGVLADHCFSVTVEVPEKQARKRILDVVARKLDILYSLKTKPDEQYTGCFWPSRCQYVNNCHASMEPNGKYGFVRIGEIS